MQTKDLNEIDEVTILEEAPVKVRVGERFVLIKQLTVREYFWVSKAILKMYLRYSAEFIAIYKLYNEAKNEKDRLKSLSTYLITVIKINGFRKELIKLLNKIFPEVGLHLPFTASYLERHATPNTIMQLLFGLYQFNVVDLKKNLQTLLDSTELRETLVSANLKSSSKENSTGPKDSSIKPRFGKSKNTSKPLRTVEA